VVEGGEITIGDTLTVRPA